MSTLKKDGLTATSGGGNPPLFTKRELQCIDLLIKYASVSEMAESLGVAENTVQFYLKNISEKARAAIKPPKKC